MEADKKKKNEEQSPDLDRGGETGRDYEEQGQNEADRRRMADKDSHADRATDATGDPTYEEEARPDEVAGVGKGKRGEEKDRP